MRAIAPFLQEYQRGLERQIEETQPERIPTAMGIAKLRSVESPKNSATTTMAIIARKVARVVLIVLPSD